MASNLKCKQCGEQIRDNSSGFCPKCGATVLSKKSKKTIVCHAIRGKDMVRLVLLVIVLLAACVFSVWNIKSVIDFKDNLQPQYEIAEEMLQSTGAIAPEFQKAHSDYKLAAIYRTYGSPVIFGVNALTALFAVMCLVRLRFSYIVTSVLNIIGLVLLCADTLCCFLYDVPMNYIYALTAFVIRILIIIAFQKYTYLARSETTRKRRRKLKKGEIDTSGTVDMYADTTMFSSDIKALKRKVEREGESDFELVNKEGEIGAVTLINKQGVSAIKAKEETAAPLVPAAKAEAKKVNDRFGEEKGSDAISTLAAAVGKLMGEEETAPAPKPEPAPAKVEAPKSEPTPPAVAKPVPQPTPMPQQKKKQPEFKADAYFSPMDELAAAIAELDLGLTAAKEENASEKPEITPADDMVIEPAPIKVEAPAPKPEPAPAKVEEKPAETESKAAKLGIFKKLQFGKKTIEEDFPEDEFGITDQEPIPLVAVKQTEESEISEEQSTLNRSAGPWQCGCGQMNFASSTSCMSCGVSKAVGLKPPSAE